MTASKNDHLLCKGGRLAVLMVLLSVATVWGRSNEAIRAFNRGVKSFNAREFNEAIPAFDDAISADSEFVEAYYARGACKYYLKSLEGALQDLNETLRLKPDYTDARALRGAIQYETDHWDGALEDFNAVLAKSPRDAQSLLGRAVILLKREDLDGAARDFRAFLKVRPNDPLAPKVRQLLATLKRPAGPETAAEPEEAAEPGVTPGPTSHATHHASSPPRQISAQELQKLVDSLMSRPLTDSYQNKVLRGEKAQAVGDIHSVTGVPSEKKANDAPQIISPQ